MKADHTIPQGKPTCNNRRTVHRTKLPYDKSNLRELSYRILANRSVDVGSTSQMNRRVTYKKHNLPNSILYCAWKSGPSGSRAVAPVAGATGVGVDVAVPGLLRLKKWKSLLISFVRWYTSRLRANTARCQLIIYAARMTRGGMVARPITIITITKHPPSESIHVFHLHGGHRTELNQICRSHSYSTSSPWAVTLSWQHSCMSKN